MSLDGNDRPMRNVRIALALSVVLVSGQALALDRAGVDAARKKAIEIVEAKGIDAGIKDFADPALGLIDLKGTGLHTWAISRKGIIKFDLSGQTTAGMDVSELRYPDGRPLAQVVFSVADNPGGGGVADASTWPHPTSGVLSNSYMSCQTLKADKDLALCAMAWVD